MFHRSSVRIWHKQNWCFMTRFPEGVSSNIWFKSRNSRRYPFANMKSFWHLMWKTVCHSGGVNSIKTNLQTCNSWTGQYVSYKYVNMIWLNLPHQNGKCFSHQMSKLTYLISWSQRYTYRVLQTIQMKLIHFYVSGQS